MNRVTDPATFVRWFRDSSPYINAHRGRTFVIAFDGEAVNDDSFAHLIHDLTLLNSLGIRLIIAYGALPQVEERLSRLGRQARIQNDLRVVDETELACWCEAAGAVRIEIESKLTMGLANSPMANAQMRVVSGNFIVARPVGVREGIDYHFGGEVRKLDTRAIQAALEANVLVLLGPVGYSHTGEVFALDAKEVRGSGRDRAASEQAALPARGPGDDRCQRQAVAPTQRRPNQPLALPAGAIGIIDGGTAALRDARVSGRRTANPHAAARDRRRAVAGALHARWHWNARQRRCL
jgi:hypothetical protein